MSKLTKLLEYSVAGNSGRRSLMDDNSFNKYFDKSEKQLLLSETGETDLVYREIIAAIVQGAERRESARKLLPIIKTESNTCRIVANTDPSGQYAEYIAEGAAINQDSITYDETNVTIKKAAVAPYITNELIEDEKFDWIELELKRAGAKLENKLNQEAITSILNTVSMTNDIDPAGGHFAITDVGRAMREVNDFGWNADSVFVEPGCYAYLLGETNLGDVTDGKHELINLNVSVLDAKTDGTTSEYWDGTDAASHYGGLVFDSMHFATIVMREDINTNQIKDPVHDLTKLVAKMRFGIGVFNPNAGCRILTK